LGAFLVLKNDNGSYRGFLGINGASDTIRFMTWETL
jgi:hypothetical protein